MIRFKFTNYFRQVFEERVGLQLDEDLSSIVLANLQTVVPHKKIDNKGRNSEYYTFVVEEKLITCVVDGNTHKVITCVLEDHHPLEFYRR